MFGENKDKFFKENKDSERSLISESVNIEGTLKSSGSIDIAGTTAGEAAASAGRRGTRHPAGSVPGQRHGNRMDL